MLRLASAGNGRIERRKVYMGYGSRAGEEWGKESLDKVEDTMLILSRKPSESVQIDSTIHITVLSVSGGRVKLGFDAPDHIHIIRSELICDGLSAAVTQKHTRSRQAK